MTEEQKDADVVSEQAVIEQTETEVETEHEPTMVPLAALQAERRKRQELQEFIARNQQDPEPEQQPEDPTALVEARVLHETNAATKREILETLYQDMNPTAVQEINKYLKPILEKKPWLAASVDSAQNRYARAYEIVNDYRHLVESKPSAKVKTQSPSEDAARIVQNAQKPRSPVEVGKSAQPGGLEYLKSIQGKKEFREYRKQVMGQS